MQRTARSGQSCLLLAADRKPTALFGTVYETVGLATRGFTTAVVPFLVPNEREPQDESSSADAQWQARTSRGRAC